MPHRALLALILSGCLVAAFVRSPTPARADEAESTAKGPYVTDLSEDSATLRFELKAPAPATVEIAGPDAGAGAHLSLRKVQSAEVTAMHTVELNGLAPATPYAYAIRVAGNRVAQGEILTPPKRDAGAPMTFLVYGDERTDEDAHAAIVRAMAATPADFLVNTGDMVPEGGRAADWQTFFDIERPLLHERAGDRPLYVAIGNHELADDAAGQNFTRYFGFATPSGPRLYGSMRVGDVRFFFLNGEDEWTGGPERAWLERALADADHEPGLAWRFAVIHHGPWSAGPHGPNRALHAAHIPELLAQHKVDLIFSGHDHMYERGDGGTLKYVLSGGGGAPLYREIHATATTRKIEPTHHFVEVRLTPDALKLVSHRLDGSILEECGFAQGHAWDCDPPVAAASSSPAPTVAAAPSEPPSSAAPSSHAGACGLAGGPGPSRGPVKGAVAVAIGAALAFARRRRR